jgi:hypothetical protein
MADSVHATVRAGHRRGRGSSAAAMVVHGLHAPTIPGRTPIVRRGPAPPTASAGTRSRRPVPPCLPASKPRATVTSPSVTAWATFNSRSTTATSATTTTNARPMRAPMDSSRTTSCNPARSARKWAGPCATRRVTAFNATCPSIAAAPSGRAPRGRRWERAVYRTRRRGRYATRPRASATSPTWPTRATGSGAASPGRCRTAILMVARQAPA